MLSNWLIDTELFASPDDLSVFQRELPIEWVKQALDETNCASLRRRKLPAELVVWLTVGIGLYRNRPITEVLSKLDLALTDQINRCTECNPSSTPAINRSTTGKSF